MNVTQDELFLNTTAAAESDTVFLQTEDSLTLNVQGDAASFSARVLGMNRVQGVENPVWQPLAAIHMADFTVVQSITKPGIYAVALSGLQGVKVVLDTVSGGKVTVFGRMGA